MIPWWGREGIQRTGKNMLWLKWAAVTPFQLIAAKQKFGPNIPRSGGWKFYVKSLFLTIYNQLKLFKSLQAQQNTLWMEPRLKVSVYDLCLRTYIIIFGLETQSLHVEL